MTANSPETDAVSAPRVAFVLEPILGHATHARNLQRLIPDVPGIRAEFHPVPFEISGRAARVPVYRSNWTIRGGLRARRAIGAMHRAEPLDALFVHTQVPAVLSPDWLRRIPTVVSIDATPAQMDSLGQHYEHAVGNRVVEGAKLRANITCFGRARHIVTWSRWARDGLAADYRVDPSKVSVIAPGVDLDRWAPPDGARPDDGIVRILFVGGDLERKGGLLLIEAFRLLRERHGLTDIELHLVTPADVAAMPGLIVHQGFGPNDPGLIELYHRSDVFCLPTAGDCLPMVLAEAGAAGLPIVSTAVGAIPEIVVPDRSGELVQPGDVDALVAALRPLVEHAEHRRRLGAGARQIIRDEHDAAANAAAIVDTIVNVVEAAT